MLLNLVKLLSPACILWVLGSVALCADFKDAQEAYFRGDYEECEQLTRTEVEKGIWNDFWSRLLIQSLLTTGKYDDAVKVYESVRTKFASSLPLRILAAEAYRYSGDDATAKTLIGSIPDLVRQAPWRYSDRENMIALGKFLLTQGEDAREVLSNLFEGPLRNDSSYVAAHIAIGELALSKADFQEAVRSLDVAAELQPTNPQIFFMLAQAWASSDAEKADAALSKALELNPRHIDSLLFQVDRLVDAEAYEDAEQILEQVLAINETTPEAWAYRAAMAHLRGNFKAEGVNRSAALAKWSANPKVDFLIGETLSQHYRFEEGIRYQQRSLIFDANYQPARFQLAQDLLRTGQTTEGWELIDRVTEDDQYNVVAFNLRTLRNRLEEFSTLEADGIIVRMDKHEAEVYGSRVLALLSDAEKVLGPKYNATLRKPIFVEIFPQQDDFAIRTFGLPGGAGYLGVCFGNLITANSPTSQGDTPANWESVLWHEFCHVVTLQKTNNRMPRWLSEGISVYEEVEQDRSWGQSMNPMYKSMILSDDFTQLSNLSSAFLRPKSARHLDFAYYESSLAVRYLIETHGRELLIKTLEDLGMGVPIEDAFSRRFGAAESLDADFEKYATELAKQFLPDTDFSADDVPDLATTEELKNWLEDHPNNYPGRQALVASHISNKSWNEALAEAQTLNKLYPEDASPSGSLSLLARCYRELGDTPEEEVTLRKLVELSSDSLPALNRLIEISIDSENWEQVLPASEKSIAVQPLRPEAYQAQSTAARQLDLLDSAVDATTTLLAMEPLDPAQLHYDLANLLFQLENFDAARIEALLALEKTPRFREAQILLVKITDARASLQTAKNSAPKEVLKDSTSLPNNQPSSLLVSPPEAGDPPTPR